MPYTITKSDSSILVPGGLSDGTIDNKQHTSLVLIGKDYAGYGQFLNENFVYLLENFARGTSPVNPLVGQLWFDTTNNILRVWSGMSWKISTGATSSPFNNPPNDKSSLGGDLWFDTTNSQLKVWSGTSWVTIGPVATSATGNSGAVPAVFLDTSGSSHVVVQILIYGIVYAVFSKDTFTSAISGFTNITAGINFNTTVSPPWGISSLASLSTGTLTAGSITSAGLLVTNNSGTTTITPTAISTTALDTSALTAATVSVGNTIIAQNSITTSSISISGSIIPSANLGVNLGSSSYWFNNIYGTAIHAQYADLAERFESDAEYEPGTVVEIGGTAEITKVDAELSDNVFGVISTKAAYLMNSKAGTDATHPPVAVQGRVPVKVIGKVQKGDRLVSAGKGRARSAAKSEITPWNVIGRALASKDTDTEGVVEAIVKINN